MAWFSFHGGHSGQFCRHAKDDLASVLERAIALGFSHYGISEHAPRYRREDLMEEERDLTPEDLQGNFTRYAEEALRLRKRYADRLAVFVGYETERLPPGDWRARMLALRASAPFDYVVGSVHDVDGVWIDSSPSQTQAVAERLGGTEALHQRYFEALADLVESIRPDVVGHLDVVRKFEPAGATFGPRATRAIERVLEAARAFGCAIDVNCGAWRRGLGPVYPRPEILRRVGAMGLRVTLGDDSHGVDSVGVGLEACLEAIRAAGIDRVSHLTRADGGVRWTDVPLGDVVRPRGSR